MKPGRIVILNGAPRSGKSSIAAAVQARIAGVWVNLGVDAWVAATPPQLRPGIGLRPGGERPDIEAHLPALFTALYDSIAATARAGLNVVVDIGHHDDYSRPLGLLPMCARRMRYLDVLFVGIYCPVELIMARRNASGESYAKGTDDDPIPEVVRRWQVAVHAHRQYDIILDTGVHTPEASADLIAEALHTRPAYTSAFEYLAERASPQAPGS